MSTANDADAVKAATRRAEQLAAWKADATQAIAIVRLGLAYFQAVTGRDWPDALSIPAITSERRQEVADARRLLFSMYSSEAPPELPDDLADLISTDAEQQVTDDLNRAAEARAVQEVRE